MKNIFIKRLIFVLLFVFLTFSLVSCRENNKEEKKSNEETILDKDEQQNSDKNSEENKKDEDKTEKPKEEVKLNYINPLTGLDCDEKTSITRPCAVMLNNLKIAAPQNGISKADIVYEITVEGAITRLMGVFSDYEDIEKIGSVRSSRDYFIDLAQSHDAIYVHAGGSPDAYAAIRSRKINNLDGVNDGPSSSFWRDKERTAKLSREHCMVTSGAKIDDGIKIKKYRTELTEKFNSPLHFNKKDSDITGENATNVKIPFTSKCELKYDSEKKLYLKSQYGEIHTDRDTKEQLTFKNVLILKAPHSSTGDEKGRINVNIVGKGEGYYITNGKYKEVIWEKDSRSEPYKLYEKDGTTLLLINPGKSYIAVAPINANIIFE